MRIAIWSNAPFTNTGYGGQVRGMIPRMQKMGHTVSVIANYGLQGSPLNWNGATIYPLREKMHNQDVLRNYVNHFAADVVISLYDIWSLPPGARGMMGVPWIGMVPVDGEPVSEQMKERIKELDYLVAYAKYGVDQFTKAGIDCYFIPHAIETETFKPGNKEQVRQKLGFPADSFLISIVAANKGFPPRKSWPEALAAFTKFQKSHPNALLYLHTTKEPMGSGGAGIYFDKLIDLLGTPRESVVFPSPTEYAFGVSDEGVAEIYQASDVMFLPTRAEGFGLPVIEAQACGCPVVVNDCSAVSDLVRNGYKVKPLQPQFLPQLDYFWQLPSVRGMVKALEKVYAWDDITKMKNALAGRKFTEGFDWDKVWSQYWVPFLEHVEETLW